MTIWEELGDMHPQLIAFRRTLIIVFGRIRRCATPFKVSFEIVLIIYTKTSINKLL